MIPSRHPLSNGANQPRTCPPDVMPINPVKEVFMGYHDRGTVDLMEILSSCAGTTISDIHLTENEPPIVRMNGRLRRMEMRPLTRHELKDLIFSILTDEQQAMYERELELDFALTLPNHERFRANIHRQLGCDEAAFRRLPVKVPTPEALGLPSIVSELTKRPNGLVLITGSTGVGKTTTLASMVELINSERESLVVCIEDPVEYIHTNKMSIIKQREVSSDTHSFASALRHALRQDPDVIVVGEMRDLETISITLTAAVTGHLVLATLHTPDAPQTIGRIIDVFPANQQDQVRVQLSECLQGVVSQLLLPNINGDGRVLATEVLIGTAAVRNLIREGQIQQLPSIMQTAGKVGMRTMDKSLVELCQRGLISRDMALSKAKDLDLHHA